MKLKLYLLLLASAICIATFAQDKYEDVVYLKNGSIIHGMIIEHVPNTSLSIKSGSNVFVYKYDEIARYTREQIQKETGGDGFGFKTKGYTGTVEVGLADYPTGSNLPMAAIMVVNAYQFNPYVALGMGVGAEISRKSIYNVPVYADMRFNFTKTRVSPYAGVGLGYNLNIAKFDNWYSSGTDYSHGIMFNPAMGVRVAINKKVGVGFNVGYKLLCSFVDDFNGDTRRALTHGVTVRAGVVF